MRRAVAGGFSLLLAACSTTPTHHAATPGARSAPAIATALVPAPQSIADRFVSGATAMLGQPYRYGGSSPGGFDCSGLVVYAAAGAGLNLPRTAHEQLHAGSPVARRDLRGGDLVFMRLSWKELHVGIALDGDRFVHAPSTGGHVRIDYLDRAPYAHGFLKARRVVGDPAPLVP